MIELDLSLRAPRSPGSPPAKRVCMEAVPEESVDCPELSYLRDIVNSAFAEADAEIGTGSGVPATAPPTLLEPLSSRFPRAGLLSEFGGVARFISTFCRRRAR